MCDRDHRPLIAHLSFSSFEFQVSSEIGNEESSHRGFGFGLAVLVECSHGDGGAFAGFFTDLFTDPDRSGTGAANGRGDAGSLLLPGSSSSNGSRTVGDAGAG